jgi:hypothetical protein
MAQWIGQFTGLTHDSKVADIEASLHVAVASFVKAEPSDKNRKAGAVRNLAKRLLTARLKQLRARISKLSEPGHRNSPEAVSELRLRLQQLEEQGPNGILKEFHFPAQNPD